MISEFGGVAVPGTKGYRYYGRAKTLPGVKELFEHAAKIQEKMTPEEMNQRADFDYFGFRDEDDGALLSYESARDEMERVKIQQGKSSKESGFEVDFTPFPVIPAQKDVEEWLVSKRREALEAKFLQGPSLDQVDAH